MRILAIIKKILKELFRDKRTLAMLFIAPIVIMVLLNAMFSANTDIKVNLSTINVPIEIVENMESIDNVTIKNYLSKEEAIKELKDENIDAIIEFDGSKNYDVTHANIDASKTAITNQVLKASLAKSGNKQIQEELIKVSPKSLVLLKSISDIKIVEHYQYGNENTGFFAKITPVLIAYFIFFFVFLISGMALLKERTSGTLDRLLATPVKRSEIVFGYILSYGIIATIQTTIIVFSAIYLLSIEVAGNILDIIIVSVILSMVALSLGIFLSTLAKSEFQMMQFIPLVIVPQMLFSGIIPLSEMASWVQIIGKILPISYAGNALNKIILQGSGLNDIIYDILILIIFIIVLTIFNIIGLKRYRKV